MTGLQNCLLALVTKGIGLQGEKIPQEGVDWSALVDLAIEHGVGSIALDGISRCIEEGIAVGIDIDSKLDLISIADEDEQYYKHQKDVMMALTAFYRKHQIKMMVLKGYGLSLNYPIPCHRPCSDIDIYLFGEQKRADELLHKELGIEIDNSHHHHTVFVFQGESIENHYDFLNVRVRKSNKRIEAKLKELSYQSVEIDGIYYPSAMLNAIFLLRHSSGNFSSTGMSVRQILDWGFFMKKYHEDINWDEYLQYIKQEQMFRFYNMMGLFCIKYLGFDAGIFHGIYEDTLFERFANDVMSPEFKEKENGNILHSLSVKPRRWWHNRWKNKLCYPDSNLSSFAYGLWAKILKPSHFRQ